MDLNKHIVTNDTNKPFHSNGFAQVANANHFGATTSESFERRRQIERNRQSIQNYQRSNIGNIYGTLRAKPITTVRPVILGRSMPRETPKPAQRYNPFP